MKFLRTSVHGHGGKHTEQAEYVVPVYVGQKDSPDFQERQAHPAELALDAFPAINQKQAPMHG